MFAEIIVNRPTHRQPPVGSAPLRDEPSCLATFTYRLPVHLRELAAVGHLVQVPLQASTALGVIAALADAPPPGLPPEAIRDVAEILDPLPVVTPTQIELARWIATECLVPLNQATRLLLPPGLEDRTMIVVSPTEPAAAPQRLTAEENAALRLLRDRGGRQRLSTLLNQLAVDDAEAVIHSLAAQGLVDARFALVPPQPAPPRIQYVRLLADDATLQAALPRLGRPSKQADLLLALARRADAPRTVTELCTLADCGTGSLYALVERGWVALTKGRTLVVALPGAGAADLGRAQQQTVALSLLLDHGGVMEYEGLLEQSGVSRATLAALEKRGLVQRITEEPLVLLTLPPGQVIDRVVELRGAQKHRAVLDLLQGTTGRVWVGGIYAQTGATLATLRALAERGLISLHTTEYERPTTGSPGASESETPLVLTPDQASVWQEIERGMRIEDNERQPFVALIHGVTGSGKTEIYLRALEATLAAGRRAIVLVPEISLTAQTVQRFEARFPGRIAVHHSQLSLGQRYAVWDRGRRGEVDVIIGPRSALFAPVPRLGLIILDEAHDDSYKQTEPIPLPSYHARDVALALGRLTGATVLLGSATPDLVTYYHATQGQIRLLELPQRILSRTIRSPQPAGRAAHGAGPMARQVAQVQTQSLPPVRIVDLRQELRANNRSIFSRALQEELHRTLAAGEQAILFLNRRGSATFVLCRDCGHVARCPHCDQPLTYHRLAHLSPFGTAEASERWGLACHHCNHREPRPAQCPNCGGRRIRYFGLGTEKVEETVRQLYPQARLLRWDRDTATGVDHEHYLQTFADHRADVLIGTQMVAKGLDLPLVTLVGVISADTALHLPDYRSAERTFQLLTQVAGRAGRSRRGDSGQSSGRVIVQTYNPDHYAIQAASRHDYAGFYRQELAHRRQLGYPPFNRLVALRFSDKDAARCQAEAQRMGRWLAKEIQGLNLTADLIGPAPCFYSRVRGRYRWQIVVRGPEPAPLLRDVALPRGWQIDVDPVSLL